jgi:uncharacterized protein
MGPDRAAQIRSTVRSALTGAMKERDAVAVDTLRSVLAAIDHAEAVDPALAPRAEQGRIAGGVAGLGAGDVPRRVLGDDDIRRILDQAITQREAAATQYEGLRRPADARRLRLEVAILDRVIQTAWSQP